MHLGGFGKRALPVKAHRPIATICKSQRCFGWDKSFIFSYV